MSKEQRRYSAEFKADAVGRLAACKNVSALAEELGIRRKFLYLWREQFAAGQVPWTRGPKRELSRPNQKDRTADRPGPSSAELRIAELEQLLGRKQVELDFFKRTFEHVRGAMADRTGDGGKAFIAASRPHSRAKEQD